MAAAPSPSEAVEERSASVSPLPPAAAGEEPITDDEESDDQHSGSEDETEEIRRIRQVMDAQGDLRGGGGGGGRSRYDASESLASRYYRNRNMSWTKGEAGTNDTGQTQPSTDKYHATVDQFRRRGSQMRHTTRGGGLRYGQQQQPTLPVGPHYICHICGEKGHHIKNCPKGNDPRRQKKIKPSTGLPRSWLRKISEDEVATTTAEVYTLPDGSYGVLKQPLDYITGRLEGDEDDASQQRINDSLRCPLCHDTFEEPMLVPCCGETYCRNCLLAGQQQEERSTTTSPDADAAASGTKWKRKCPGCGSTSLGDGEENQPYPNEVISAAASNAAKRKKSGGSSNILLPDSHGNEQNSFAAPSTKTEGGDVGTSNNATAPSLKGASDHQPSVIPQAVPPGTLRLVRIPSGVARPKPLGARLLLAESEGRRFVEANPRKKQKT